MFYFNGKKTSTLSKFLIANLIPAILFLQLLCPFASNQYMLFAQDNQTCESTLNQAENNYYEGNFDETISLIRECLKNPELKQPEKIRAYKILSRTLLAQDNINATKEIINKIIDLEPEFSPTIEEETPQFVTIINEVKLERMQLTPKQNEGASSSSWLWYALGGAAATAIVVAIIIDGGDDKPVVESENLPEPPNFP